MTIIPLGALTTNAGTRKQLTAVAAHGAVNRVAIRALAANTNDVHVGDVTVVAATGVGVADILDSSVIFEVHSRQGNDIDATKIYFDVDTNGEGVTAWLEIV